MQTGLFNIIQHAVDVVVYGQRIMPSNGKDSTLEFSLGLEEEFANYSFRVKASPLPDSVNEILLEQ